MTPHKLSSALRKALGTGLLTLALSAQADLNILQIAPLTGPYGGIGWHMQVGAQVAIQEVNARGGVAGHKLKLISLNQEPGDPVAQFSTQIDRHSPAALIGGVGDETMDKLIASGVLQSRELVLVGPRVGAQRITAASGVVFPTRASVGAEVARVLKHHAGGGLTSVGVVYEESGFGAEAWSSASSEAKRLGIKPLGATFLAGSALVDQAVTQMLAQAPQAIILATQTAGAAAFVQRYRARGGTAQLTALSTVEGAHLPKIIGKGAAHGVAVVELAPNTLNEGVPMVRDFRASFRKFGPTDVEPTQTMMEAYLATRVLAEGLKRANGNRAKLAGALTAMDRVDLGGLAVSFSGGRRAGVEYADLAVIDRQGRVIR